LALTKNQRILIVSDFEEIRTNLIDLLEDLDQRLDTITDATSHLDNPITNDIENQLIASKNVESIDFLAKITLQDIEKIKQALSQIDQGTYGICSSCGVTIQKQQLSKTPFSNLCIQCQNKDNDRES
jgi:RNA polymerase-binding transcription factor DksA